jgi:hypothetical protein
MSHGFVVPKDAKLVAATVAKLQEKTIVTLNDVKISKVIEQNLLSLDNTKKQIALKESVELDDVSKTVLETVALLEAATFKYASYDESLFKKLTDLLLQSKELDILGVKTLKEIEFRVKEKLIAKSFIALRSENLKTVVNDSELRTYYEKNRTQFADMPFEKFRNTIREYYLKEKLNEKLNEWFSVLKSKYQVRIYDINPNPKTAAE